MLGKFENGKRVRILPLKDPVLQDRYPAVNPNAGKEGKIRWGGTSKIGPLPYPLIEPTIETTRYTIDLDDGTRITAPHEALELLE